jgi:hypothetical protein
MYQLQVLSTEIQFYKKINWEGSGNKLITLPKVLSQHPPEGSEKQPKTSIRVACLWAMIRTWKPEEYEAGILNQT